MENGEDGAPGGRMASKANRIQVVVRVRPVLPHEQFPDVAVTCSPESAQVQVLLPERGGDKRGFSGAPRSGARSYDFDACLTGATTQAEVFDVCGLSELVDAALDGYSVTVFAFGQTGSGKTHTMIGPRLSRVVAPGAAGEAGPRPSVNPSDLDEEDGVLMRCLHHAYRSIEARAATTTYSVSGSCVELYNEAVTDLLALDKSKTLQVRKDARDGFQVVGLTQLACPSADAAQRYLARAMQYRHTRSHRLNEYSSRSHCLSTFVFASEERTDDGATTEQGAAGGVRRYGKLSLVDLAGSERLKSTGNSEKEAVRETGAINKSLFTLGQVLAGLSVRGSTAPSFIPFRDSKLTQLLWDGLRGSGRTLMLACLGPLKQQAEESLNTLHFASMAIRIKAEPVVLLDPQDALVLELRNTIQTLRGENRQLASALSQISSGADLSTILSSLPDTLRPPDTAPAALTGSGSSNSASVAQLGGPWPGSEGAITRNCPGASRDLFMLPTPSASSPSSPAPRSRNAGNRQSVSSFHSPLAALADGGVSYNYNFANLGTRQGSSSNGPDRRPSPSHRTGPSPVRRPQPPGGSGGSSSPAIRSRSVDVPARRQNVRPLLQQPSGNLLDSLPMGVSPKYTNGGSRTSSFSQKHLLPSKAGSTALPAPPAAVDLFPELAALEAQFQSLLSGVPSEAQSATGETPADPARHLIGSNLDLAGYSPQRAEPLVGEDMVDGPTADVRALKWAGRNTWFGSDVDMTTLAYKVHDDLVDMQRMDPISDPYYAEIERQVADAFPAKWAAFQHAHAARKAERQRHGPGRSHANPHLRKVDASAPTDKAVDLGGAVSLTRRRNSRPAERASATVESRDFGAALRAHLRETAPIALGKARMPGSPSSMHAIHPVGSLMSSHPPVDGTTTTAGYPTTTFPALSASASVSHPYRPPTSNSSINSSSPPAQTPSSSTPSTPHLPRQSSGLSNSSGQPTTPPSMLHGSGFNPFNISSLQPSLPPSYGRSSQPAQPHLFLHASMTSLGQSSPIRPPAGSSGSWSPSSQLGGQAGKWLADALRADTHYSGDAMAEIGASSLQAAQAEYIRQRGLVLEELRQAKEEAEEERRRILAKINSTLSTGRWRT